MQIKIEGGTPADFQVRLESILCAEDGVLDPSDAAALAKTLTQRLGVRSDLINEFPFRVKTVDLLIHNTVDAEDEIHDLLSNLRDDNPNVIVEWAGHQPTREVSGPAARKHFESEVEYPEPASVSASPRAPSPLIRFFRPKGFNHGVYEVGYSGDEKPTAQDVIDAAMKFAGSDKFYFAIGQRMVDYRWENWRRYGHCEFRLSVRRHDGRIYLHG